MNKTKNTVSAWLSIDMYDCVVEWSVGAPQWFACPERTPSIATVIDTIMHFVGQ